MPKLNALIQHLEIHGISEFGSQNLPLLFELVVFTDLANKAYRGGRPSLWYFEYRARIKEQKTRILKAGDRSALSHFHADVQLLRKLRGLRTTDWPMCIWEDEC